MKLSETETNQYRDSGFLLKKSLFSLAEVELIKSELPAIFGEETSRRVLEKDGLTVRSVYGSHQTNALFGRLTRHPKLLEPARQILGGDVYVYQFKINVKAAVAGDVWEWHQDFPFWHHEDGMPEPQVVNAALFLDDVSEENGPLQLIPGSQNKIVGDSVSQFRTPSRTRELAAHLPDWTSHVNTNLKYALEQDNVSKMVDALGIATPTACAGSVLFFHPSIVHGSAANKSAESRVLILVSYNRTTNIPLFPTQRRPEFLSNWDNKPLNVLWNHNLSGEIENAAE